MVRYAISGNNWHIFFRFTCQWMKWAKRHIMIKKVKEKNAAKLTKNNRQQSQASIFLDVFVHDMPSFNNKVE